MSEPVRKSLLLAVDAITSFSQVPLRFASYLGFALSVFAFVYILVVIGLTAFAAVSVRPLPPGFAKV